MDYVKYFFALVFLAFVTGTMECMNPIVLMVLLVYVIGLMEILNAVYYYEFVGIPNRWDEFLRRVLLE